MPIHENKAVQPKNQHDSQSTQRQHDGEQASFQLKDNRPETASLRKIQHMANNYTSQEQPIQEKQNNTGLPDNLKSGIENLSGYAMDDVKVHRNSAKPAQLQAHAYAQGSEIHLGSGQEKHLPHEAWHVVQQKQGRVKPTKQLKSKVNINDDASLEKEADVMGAMALSTKETQFESENSTSTDAFNATLPIQRLIELEYDDNTGSELDDNESYDANEMLWRLRKDWKVPMSDELIAELKTLDKANTIFSDTPELLKVLASKGVVVKIEEDEFIDTAKVGLELTFNSYESKHYVKNDGFPIGEKSEAKSWWKGELKGWTSGLEHEPYIDPYELEVEIEKGHEQKALGGGAGDMENWRVIYKNYDDDVVWWWQISMDPSVVEIQTAPVTGSELLVGITSDILATIFGRAEGRGYTAGGGGGHVNVDFVTGFEEDTSLIPKVLLATEIVIGSLRRERDETSAALIDVENEMEDPFINTGRVRMKTKNNKWDPKHLPDSRDEKNYGELWEKQVMAKYKVKNMKTLKKFRDAHALWLHSFPTLSQQKGATEKTGKLTEKADEEGLNTVLHYQAVNIDHLFEEIIDEDSEVIEDPRRLEFRFFKGQKSIDEIIACIKLIKEVVATAKRMT